MSLPNWLSFCSNEGRGSLLKLYIIAVIAVRAWGEYYLADFVVVLDGPTIYSHNATAVYGPEIKRRPGDPYYKGYTRSVASLIINAKDGFAGIFGFIGAILLDVYLTDYGLIFFSSLIYGVGLLLIVRGLDNIYEPNFILAITGLFMSGAANHTLKNSSNNLAEAKTDSDESKTNRLISFIQSVFGNNVKAKGLIIVIIYATKVMFVVVAIVLDHLSDYHPKMEHYKEYASFAQLLIPTIGLLLMAVVSLVHVKTFVKPANKRGTPLKVVIRVCVTAFRKRHLDFQVEMLHEGKPEHPLPHTNSLRFLDKAAMPSSQTEEDRGKQRLCTITEVEETKRLFRLVPMCTCFLLYGMVNSVGTTFFLLQGNEMDATLGSSNLEVPLQTLIIFGEISGLVTKFLYVILILKRLSQPAKRSSGPANEPAKRLSEPATMYPSLIKYAIGIVLATFCCTVASWTGTDKGPRDSVFWLTPQFLLFGAMNEVTRDGIQSFFQDQLPPSLKSYNLVFADAIIGAGAVFCAALVYASRRSIDRDEENPELRRPFRNLGIFYRLLTGVCFAILCAYTFVAIRYRYQGKKDAQPIQEEKNAQPIQEVP